MSKRIHQLDGVRGLAILAVMLHNESAVYPSLHLQNLFANGWMGVDLFFVLSGFLITGILLDTRESGGYFVSFYSKRVLRIWPLYFALLLFMFVVVPFVRPSVAPSIVERSSPWWAYPLFLQNFLVPNAVEAAGPLGVTWSLAIEEQFYLVWPLFVRYCTRKQLIWIAVAVICMSPVGRLFLRQFEVNLYSNTFSRLDGLMAGAVLAISARSTRVAPGRFTRLAWVTFIGCLMVAFAAESADARWLAFSFSALASVSFVYLALYSQQTWLRRLLSNRFLVYTGTISYGLYLLHKIPFDAAKEVPLPLAPVVDAVLLFGACYLIAAASWNILEKPFLRLKARVEPRDRSPRLSPSFN